MKKQTIYKILMWHFSVVSLVSLFLLFVIKGTWAIVLMVFVIVGAMLSSVFSALVNREKRKQSHNFLASSANAQKEDIANTAYNQPLKRTEENDDKNNISFNDWLNAELENLRNAKTKAFDINIYENVDGGVGVELIASKMFDENNDDWAWSEFYSSRANGEVFYFKAKSIEEASEFIRENLTIYLITGANAEILKKADAVAFGFVDGALEFVYKKEQWFK